MSYNPFLIRITTVKNGKYQKFTGKPNKGGNGKGGFFNSKNWEGVLFTGISTNFE
jgi:hypothetical protein